MRRGRPRSIRRTRKPGRNQRNPKQVAAKRMRTFTRRRKRR